MKSQVISRICRFLNENRTFLILFVAVIALVEITSYDSYSRIWLKNELVQKNYLVDSVELNGFLLNPDGQLVAQTDDPNITLYPDIPVKAIGVRCSVGFQDSSGQVFYRSAGEQYSPERSGTFRLKTPFTIIQLPQVIQAASIRLDLTNRAGDTLQCQDFTINPRPVHFALVFRIIFYLIVLIAWIVYLKLINPKGREKLRNWFSRFSLLFFITLMIGIDLLYTITITWDSGHYLWLADVIRQGTWATWDPIRNLLFPLNIYLSQAVFGYSVTGLLIPMIIAHVTLFILSYLIILEVFKPRFENRRLLIQVFLFIFIALDPTVIGYFHVLLTEYVAATIAMLSCFAAFLLFKSILFPKRFYALSAFFLVMIPLAWHVKQPYIGAALFPFATTCLMLLIQHFSKKTVLYVLISSIALAALVLGSTVAWNGFLKANDNPMKEDRQLSSFTEKRLNVRSASFLQSPLTAVKLTIKQYLKITNVILLDKNKQMSDFSLTRGFQNSLIGQKMFIYTDSLNVEQSAPFEPYIYYLKDVYNSPSWLNRLFQFRLAPSNFLFTVTYLVLPFYVIFLLVNWIRRKTPFNALLLILGASSLLNVLLHLLVNQIDRYLFWGYPLNLLVISILVIQLINVMVNRLKKPHNINPYTEIPASTGE